MLSFNDSKKCPGERLGKKGEITIIGAVRREPENKRQVEKVFKEVHDMIVAFRESVLKDENPTTLELRYRLREDAWQIFCDVSGQEEDINGKGIIQNDELGIQAVVDFVFDTIFITENRGGVA